MSKRFTCTDKWNDPWFSELPPTHKLLWLYILDKCDHAGFFKPNLKAMILYCDMDISTSKESIKEFMDGRIHAVGDEWFIPKFLKFQYPKGLSSNKPAIKSVVNILTQKGVYSGLSSFLGNDYLIVKEPLLNDYLIIKDKDKSMDKDMVKDEDKPTDPRNDPDYSIPKTVNTLMEEIFGTIDPRITHELMTIGKKVDDIGRFTEIAKKVYSEADQGFKPGQLILAQKTYAEYNQKQQEKPKRNYITDEQMQAKERERCQN